MGSALLKRACCKLVASVALDPYMLHLTIARNACRTKVLRTDFGSTAIAFY